MRKNVLFLIVVICAVMTISIENLIFANGGPFIIKYPNGDPAAKGVLARLDSDLKPTREKRLRVLKEDLKISIGENRQLFVPLPQNFPKPPIINVSAEYMIENPTDKEIEVDFGFPILRGIYMNHFSMLPRPDVKVSLNEKNINCTIISNSAIYGIIRQRCRELIDSAVDTNADLKKLVSSIQNSKSKDEEIHSKALLSYLTNSIHWNERDALLMIEYASLDFDQIKGHPLDRSHFFDLGSKNIDFNMLLQSNLGCLSAIGEQKATQFFAQLAACFEPKSVSAYEDIFTAWGGEVRELALDLETGRIRPRELTIEDTDKKNIRIAGMIDPTIYARIDYLNPHANITEQDKETCKTILKNLPVVFTFSPMNILHYRATFKPESTNKLTVNYKQYAFSDTKKPSSYQLAYVLHPASLWDDFGPINLIVTAPKEVIVRASAPSDGLRKITKPDTDGQDTYTAILKDKTGELYLAVNAQSWDEYILQNTQTQEVVQLKK